MVWYTAFYGSWNDPDGVKVIDRTYSRKVIFEKAREAAKTNGVKVTIIADRGIKLEAYEVV